MKKRIAVTAVYLALAVVCVMFAAKDSEAGGQSFQDTVNMLEYQLDYPRLYCWQYSPHIEEVTKAVRSGESMEEENEVKTVYLTFDDGPSPRTQEILDILEKHDVKATFFVIKNEKYAEYMEMAALKGHTIGIHSTSHKYREIYESVDAYLRDFQQCYDFVYQNTKIQPSVFRFPGGSVNNYNVNTRKDIVAEMTRRGFVYFDWNVESSDGTGKLSADTIYNNVINGCKGKNRAVVIMHDSIDKKTTVRALDRIITHLKEDGWTFAAIDADVKPVIFRMK